MAAVHCNTTAVDAVLLLAGVVRAGQQQQGKVVPHFLPPYCPEHNRIERTWRDLHDNVTRNHQCRIMEQLMSDVVDYLLRRNREMRRQRTKVAA